MLIGLTPSGIEENGAQLLHASYIQTVLQAGGCPVILPASADKAVWCKTLQAVDGVVLTGGADVNPRLYGEEVLPECGGISALRDDYELPLCRMAIELKKPLLAVCRGIQVLNVALGGSLYQDLKTQLGPMIRHPNFDQPAEGVHTIQVEKNTLLESILQAEEIKVNSRHHQGIKRLAEGLTVCAKAPDGLVEAVSLNDYPFGLGIQWHPESMYDKDIYAKRVWDAFIGACKK